MESKLPIKLAHLISDYQAKVAEGVQLLEQATGGVFPLQAWRQGILPQKGKLGMVNYYFHGVGCALSFPDCTVDFDYAPTMLVPDSTTHSRFDGFDLWRLDAYLDSCPKYYPTYSCEQLKIDFAEAVKDKLFTRIENSHLYFLLTNQ